MQLVQIFFPNGSAGNLVSWVVEAVLETASGFGGISWGGPINPSAKIAIFLADPVEDGDELDLNPIRRAIRLGLTVFVVTGYRGCVFPVDLGPATEKGKVYFFHAGRGTAGDGFLVLNDLAKAVRLILNGSSLAELERGISNE